MIQNLSNKIKEQLDTLTGSGQPLAVVFDYHTLDNKGQFPYVTFEADNLESEVSDTCNNLRTYTFDIYLFQEIINNGRQTAKDILYNSFDKITELFDKNFILDGLADGGVIPSKGTFGQIIDGNGKTLFVNLKLSCKVLHNIN